MSSVLLQNYFHCLKNIFSLKGRVCRSEYWAFAIIHTCILFFFVYLSSLLNPFSGIASGFFTLLLVAFPFVSVKIKRLHDFNASGFYILLSFVPVVNLILNIVCAFWRGNHCENQYGNPTSLETITELDYIIILLVIGGTVVLLNVM